MRVRLKLIAACLLALWSWSATQRVLAANVWDDKLRGRPLIASFDVPPTRHNGEVWSFAPAGDGEIWVGSDELFTFNGETRESVGLPNDMYAVRALARDRDGKLWVGAIGDIGHLERTPTGAWRYVSSREALREVGVENVRVWEALNTPEGVVFVADDQVLRWNGTKFQRWPMQSGIPLRTTRDRDTLWIVQPGIGIFGMERDGPRLMWAAADLPGGFTWAVGSSPNVGTSRQEPLMLGGLDGVYVRRGGAWKKLDRLSAAIADRTPWRAISLDEKTVALGTAVGGVVIATSDDEIIEVFNRSNGLPNDTVTSLWFDERHRQLWIGYLGGMSRVEVNNAASLFNSQNGLSDGLALKVVLHGGQTYVLNRRAFSIITPRNNDRAAVVRQLGHQPTPFSDALSKGSNLWLGGSGGGLHRVVGDDVKSEFPSTIPSGTYISALTESREPSVELYFADGRQLRAMTLRSDQKWEPIDLDADIGSYAISAVRDDAGELWISTVTRGIVRFRIESAGAKLSVRVTGRYYAGHGLPGEAKRPQLTTLGGKVIVLSGQSAVAYDRQTDVFNPVPGLEQFTALAGTVSADPTVAYWVVRNVELDPSITRAEGIIRLRANGGDRPPSWEPLDSSALNLSGRLSSVSFTGGEAPALWIGGSQALVRMPIGESAKPPPPPEIELRGLERNGRPHPLPLAGGAVRFDADTTHVRLDLGGIKRAEGDALLVQAYLGGVSDQWSKPQSDAAFEYTGLRAGSYTFNARSVDRFGYVGPIFTQPFVLEPPWYQSVAAVIAYFAAGLLAIVAGVRWRLRHLHRLTVRLNQIVDQRTAELTRANVARNEFLEAISHEIRNPLNGITNLVDLLHDEKLNPEAQKLAESLGRSAAQLKQVFGDVLGYTKLEYGHVELKSVTFSLKELLDDVIALFAVQAREQRNELQVTWPADFVDGFSGDAEKIRVVVSNFVINALKYAPAGAIEIVVRITPHDPAQQACHLWLGVRDYGPGIAAEEQKHLFHKFARGQNAKARGISGTGLGLAICRGIAELLDGKVGVISSEGHGATFWLEVPVTRTPLTTSSASPSAPDLPTAVNANAAVALIVDDHEYNRAVLSGIAKRLGYQANAASCADEVWPLIDKTLFGLVFLDWELPGLSGGEIARRLREHPNARDAVIIATTAHDTADIVQQCLDSGMDGFAAKPFDTAQMRVIVGTAAARRAGRSTEASATRSVAVHESAASVKLTLTAFADFAAGDPARGQQAVTLFFETLDQEVAALQAAIAAEDRETIGRRAHRLRSHAGLVNGAALNAAAQKLVLAARSASPDAWQECTQAVFEEAAALKSAVAELVAKSALH